MRRLSAPRWCAILILLALPALVPAAQAAQATAATPAAVAALPPPEQARALFERDWQWRLRNRPEFATGVGEHRYDALLSDSSLAGAARALEHERRMLELARLIDREQLSDQERLSYDLFVGDKERLLAGAAFVPFEPQPISAQDGFQWRFPQLVAQMPFYTEEDYRNYLARLQALPHYIDGVIEQLREGARTGWAAPKAIMVPLPAQLRALREHLPDGALSAPFRRLPATIAPELRERLAADGAGALRALAPALQKLEEFIRTDYLPVARAGIAASNQPGGAAWYAFLVKNATTTNLSPGEIHAIGLQEVARIRDEMGPVVRRTGFRGTLLQFFAFARSDPRLFYTDPDALLGRYRRTVARATSRLSLLVNTVPPDELAVKPVQDAGAVDQGAAYYEAGSDSRAAALVVNTSRLNTRPMWQVDTLALHEGVPGHHLQVARAQAIPDLPAFRRHAWYGAFGEGWALYAEGLGGELGFFRDPFSDFGRLSEELLRAARLVIDTGIHAQGWSRRQALDYLNANTANPPSDNELEVDRVIAQPGQVLAYKIGQLRILALRHKAESALGERFDERDFHDAVLENGALPLDVLEQQIKRWIAARGMPATSPAVAAPPAATAAPPGSATPAGSAAAPGSGAPAGTAAAPAPATPPPGTAPKAAVKTPVK